jgi:HYPK UBA domain
MVEAKAQAAQLDSVTDVVQEQEVDAARALQAMNAFMSDGSTNNNSTNSSATTTHVTSNSKDTDNTVELSSDVQQKLNISNVATASTPPTTVIRQEDVLLICNEMDVTEDVATQALRDAANELTAADIVIPEKDTLVILALRKLVKS